MYTFLTVYYVDSTGTCVAGKVFSVGSGSNFAYSVIDDALRDRGGNITLSEVVEKATWAIRHAAQRDSFSGGVINIVHVNRTGCHHIQRIDSRSMNVEPGSADGDL
jgi:20S proteasome subunit beta 5